MEDGLTAKGMTPSHRYVVVALVVVLMSCGGDDGEPVAPPTPAIEEPPLEPEPTPGPPEETIAHGFKLSEGHIAKHKKQTNNQIIPERGPQTAVLSNQMLPNPCLHPRVFRELL